jgi:hypothetical protein
MRLLMKFRTLTRSVLTFLWTVTLLGGCTGGGVSLVEARLEPHRLDGGNMLVTPSSVHPRLHAVRTHAMTRSGVPNLLYVSDVLGGSNFKGAVQVYDYPSGSYVGQLSPPPEGFLNPQGECVDNSGDVFIANTGATTIDEYAHNGTFVQALSDPGQYPVACAFDPTSGNLSVANILDRSNGSGNVAVYAGAAGTATIYPVPNMYRVYSVGYAGTSGTLYLDGSDSAGRFHYDSLLGTTFKTIKISGATFAFPAGVQWSGKTKSMNIAAAPTIYQIAPSGKITNSTVLTCSGSSGGCNFFQYFIKGGVVVCADPTNDDVALFNYPAGGDPIAVISGDSTLIEPIGVAVSLSVH